MNDEYEYVDMRRSNGEIIKVRRTKSEVPDTPPTPSNTEELVDMRRSTGEVHKVPQRNQRDAASGTDQESQ